MNGTDDTSATIIPPHWANPVPAESQATGKKKQGGDDEFGFNHQEPTIKLGGQHAPTSNSTTNVGNTNVPMVNLPSSNIPHPICRSSYQDKSLYDSAREVEMLVQTQKSLQESYRAKNNKGAKGAGNVITSPPDVNKISISARAQQIQHQPKTTKSPRARKPSKSSKSKAAATSKSTSKTTDIPAAMMQFPGLPPDFMPGNIKATVRPAQMPKVQQQQQKSNCTIWVSSFSFEIMYLIV